MTGAAFRRESYPMNMQGKQRAGIRAGWAAVALALVAASAADARARKAAAAPAQEAKPTLPRSAAPLFAVVLGPGPTWKRGQPLRRAAGDSHFRYWQDLHRQGRVESAGPVGKDTGFALLHARSQREANALLAADPAVRSGQFRAVARPYDETFAGAD